jgi:hypothetical protein
MTSPRPYPLERFDTDPGHYFTEGSVRNLTPRLLTKGDAAAYCRMSFQTFQQVCPVSPIAFGKGKRLIRYDVRDVDEWLDRLRGDGAPSSADGWLGRLRRDRRAG